MMVILPKRTFMMARIGCEVPVMALLMPMLAALDDRQETESRSRSIRGEHATHGMKSMKSGWNWIREWISLKRHEAMMPLLVLSRL